MANYCTLKDVQRIFSVSGVNYRLDDDPAVISEVLGEASREVDMYLLTTYTADQLSGNDWVRYQTANIAAMLFAERRGNPPPSSIQAKYDRTMEKLQAIHLGQLRVPGLAPRRTDVPTLSQPRIRLDPYPRTVIERQRGSSRNRPTDYSQPADTLEWFDAGSGI